MSEQMARVVNLFSTVLVDFAKKKKKNGEGYSVYLPKL